MLSSVAEQMMSGREVSVEGRSSRVSRTGSQWRRVVQVRDLGTQKYVEAVVDGKVTEYTR